MSASLKFFVTVMAALPVLMFGAPTPSTVVCGHPDRILVTTGDNLNGSSNKPLSFQAVCNDTFLYRQSLLLWTMNLNGDMTKAIPPPELDFIDQMPVDPMLTISATNDVEQLVNNLGLYEMEMFCVGEALATLEYFQGTTHSESLCLIVNYGHLVARVLRQDYGVVASGNWMQERATCSHFKWPLLLKNEADNYLANHYSISVVRRYWHFLESWNIACL